MQDLSWNDVRLLLALGRSSSLGEAAKKLSVDGSTVSRRLTALEDTLAATLFERGRSGIVATEAAEQLIPIAEEIEYAMARFTGTAEALEREVSGLVRIACPPDAAEVMLVPLLPKLLAKYPGLRVQIEAAEGLVDIARRGTDIALRIVRPQRGDLVVTRLDSVQWVVAGAAKMVEGLKGTGSLQAIPWIGSGEKFGHTPPARWLAENVPGLDPVLRSDSLRLQISAAKQGLGMAVIPELSVTHYGLQSLPIPKKLCKTALPENELYLVTHRALRAVPRVRVVWEFLKEQIG